MTKFLMHIIDKMLTPIYGKKAFQKTFYFLYNVSLKGMNYGGGGDIHSGGEMELLKLILKNHSLNIVFDVGANIGEYTHNVVKVSPASEIHCFEPNSLSFKQLSTSMTGLKKVVVNNIALGDKNENAVLYFDKQGSKLASVYQREMSHRNFNLSDSEQIRITTLDSYCIDHKIDKIDLLKIDAEGNEFKILKGAQDLLDNGLITMIQFEFGGSNIDSKTYFMDFWYFLKDNYNIYRVLKNGLLLIGDYNEDREIFLNVNFLAIKKELNLLV